MIRYLLLSCNSDIKASDGDLISLELVYRLVLMIVDILAITIWLIKFCLHMAVY